MYKENKIYIVRGTIPLLRGSEDDYIECAFYNKEDAKAFVEEQNKDYDESTLDYWYVIDEYECRGKINEND